MFKFNPFMVGDEIQPICRLLGYQALDYYTAYDF
jgi:hypothetical protein